MDLLDKLLKTLEKTTDPYLIALSSCRISVLYFHVGGLTKATHYAEIALTKSKKITTQSHRRWFTILALTLMIEIGLRLNQCDQISLNKLRSI